MAKICLSSNLQEITASANDLKTKTLSLVADFSGSKIFHTSSAMGRVWKWIFTLLDLVFDKQLEEKMLLKAMRKTGKAFLKSLSKVHKEIKLYENYLQVKFLNLSVKEEAYHSARRNITRWNTNCAPFIEKLFFKECKKIQEAAAFLFPEPFTKEQEKDLLFYLPTLQQLIDLEGYLHQPLPLHLFNKLAKGENLKEKEKKELKKWIQKYNKKGSPLSIRPFHLALKALTLSFSSSSEKAASELVNLEYQLASFGIDIFSKRDAKHLKWRSKLKPGSVLKGFKTSVVLGEQIGKKRSEEENNLIFSIKGAPDKVAIIGINQAILALKSSISAKNGWGIPSAAYIEIDASGNFALIESLGPSLLEHTWSKKSKKHLSTKDLDILVPIANMLKWMIQQNMSPSQLEPKHFRFDSKGVLKYAKIALPEKFNYSLMEDFVIEVSQGKKTVFSYLMKNSGLSSHPYRKYYYRMLKAALDEKKPEGSTIAAFEGISDPRVVEKGELLFEKATEMLEVVRNTVLLTYHSDATYEIESAIKEEMRAYYNKNKLAGSLWPEMEKEISQEVVKTHGNSLTLRHRLLPLHVGL